MATAINTPARAGSDIKLEYGQPQDFAFKFLTGKNVQGNYGPRVLFTTADDCRLWLDAEDGSDLERGLRDLGIQPGDCVRVTKIRHPRGGGHSIRVEAAEETRLESDLRKSIEMQSVPHADHHQQPNNNPVITPVAAKFMAAYMVAIDILLESQAYAKRHGLLLNIGCEDVRCLAATVVIDAAKGGR